MTNQLTMAKKAFTIAVAATTILWTVGISAFVPLQASAASYGDLIKGTTLSTVYYYGSTGQRYAFPNEKTFFSWYNDFSSVKTISDAELAAITLAGNVAARPGSRWIKITSDAKVYAVSAGGKIRWVENEATAKGLAGDSWNTHIDDVPDVFFVDYTVGDSLTSAASGYEGMLWTDGTSKYRVTDGKLAKVTDAGFTANRFKSSFVLSGTGFSKASLTAGADVSGELANLTDSAQKVTSATYAVSENVSVSLASSSPAASTILAGQAIANLAQLEFSNPTSKAVSVKKLTLKRLGVSNDSTLSNVYLFDGWTRLSDSATVSSGVVSWNDASGLFTIPAGGKKVVGVRTDVAASTSGQTLGVKLDKAADVEFVGSYAATGSFPLSSALHTVASVSNFGTISFATSTTPAANTSVNPENDYRVWENSVTVGNNEAFVYSLRFRNIGSINADDVGNWRLYIAGVMKGTAVAKQDANGYVSFDLSAAPVKLNTGTHTFKVLADIVGGSTRTVTVGLRNAADAVILEEDYSQPILVQANSTTFSARDAGAQTISSGDVTFTKRSDSPSGNTVNGASNVLLARFDVKATGEAMKIENLSFNVADDDSDTAMALRNGAVYANGVQIGNTTALCNNDTTTAAACTGVAGTNASYTIYNFGSSFIVYPGTPAILEVRADIFDSVGTNGMATADTILLTIDGTSASSNVLRKTSGSYISRPSADVTANTLTVREGVLTVARNSSLANQTIVAPKTNYKVGVYTITSSTSEPVTVTGLTVDLDGSSGEEASEINNFYVKYGAAGALKEATVKTAPSLADAGNVFSVDHTLEAGKTMWVEVYADIDTTIDATDVVITTMAVSATAKNSGASADVAATTGQSITIGSGTFTTAVDGSTPVAFNSAANKEVSAAKFRFTSSNESYTIKEMQFSVAAAAATGNNAGEVRIYDGSTLLGSAVFNKLDGDYTDDGESSSSTAGTAALITGLSIPVASNSYKTLTAKLVLSNVGTGAATSQVNVALSLDAVRVADSQGVETTDGNDRAGNELRVYKSIPTVSAVDLTNSTIVNGQAVDLYKFTVTASSNGSVALKQLAFPVTFSDGLGASDTDGASTLEFESWKLYKNGSDITASVLIANTLGVTVESTTGILEDTDTVMYVIWDTAEEVVDAGETVTYVLRATPQGFNPDGDTGEVDSISLYLAGDATHNDTDVCLGDNSNGDLWDLGTAVSGACTSATTGDTVYNFTWSDMSGSTHNGATQTGAGDWANGYLVLNLDLAGETWSK